MQDYPWQPPASGNDVSRQGAAVIKRYQSGVAGYYRERHLLPRLAPLPVPAVLPGSRPGELHLACIDGVTGNRSIEEGSARNLLFEMGQFLRLLHKIEPASVADILTGEGTVLVHGDFAPYNCLMQPDGSGLRAILDWENAHLGDAIEDLAWCEWQFRNRYPEHAWAVSALFEGFGSEPAWRERESAIAAKLQLLHKSAQQPEPHPLPEHFGIMRFSDRGEMSAFVAALSRYLNAPQGQAHRSDAAPVKVWQRLAQDGSLELQLNHAALNASAAAFGHIRLRGVQSGTEMLPTRLILGPGQQPAWGAEEVAHSVLS